MTPPKNNTARRAFTLIELLTVIAIIGILAAMVIAIGPGVAASQRASRTKGEINTLSTALEDFQRAYSHYPMIGSAADSQSWQRTLYKCMVGTQVQRPVNGEYQLVNFDAYLPAGKSVAVRKSFIDDSSIDKAKDLRTGEYLAEEMQFFVDAWGHGYEYRYNTLSGGRPGQTWERPGFLLISAGKKVHTPDEEQPGSSDYFTGGMETTGRVSENYFDDEFLSDNITNWRVD